MTTQATDPHASNRTITDAILVQLGARALGMVASVVTVAATTRALGVAGYGLLTTAVVFVGLWTSLTELGIGSVIVRRVSGSPAGNAELAELTGISIGMSLVYCLPLSALAACSGLLAYQDRPDVRWVLIVVCLSLAITAVSSSFTPVFMATMRFRTVASADLLSRLASLVGTGLVIACRGGLVWFGVVALVPPIVQLVAYAVATHRLGLLRIRIAWAASWSLLRESLPQTGVLIIATLYWRADAVILTLFGSVREVGAYGLAYTVAFTASVVSTFYLTSSLSTMAGRFADERTGFAEFVASGFEAMLFLGMPIAVIGALLAHPIIELLASSSFAGLAAAPLALLLVSVALTFLTGVLSQALFAAHDQQFLLRLNVVNLALNIVLNLVLVPLFGAVGSAVALLISEISGLLVASWRLQRRSPYRPPWRFIARLLLPLLVGGVVAVVARPLEVVVALALAGVAYLAANLILGPVRLSTMRAMRGGVQ